MASKSYGLIVYRREGDQFEFLIAHPSGKYNKNQPYMFPKGGKEDNESDQDAALREAYEESGVRAEIEIYLGEIVYPSRRKKVKLWLAKYMNGKVEEDGTVLNHDWENDDVRFVSYKKALNLLRSDYANYLKTAYSYLIQGTQG